MKLEEARDKKKRKGYKSRTGEKLGLGPAFDKLLQGGNPVKKREGRKRTGSDDVRNVGCSERVLRDQAPLEKREGGLRPEILPSF